MKAEASNFAIHPTPTYWRDGAIVLCVTLAVFSPVLWTGFSPIDDYSMLKDNPAFASASFTGFWEQLTKPQFSIFAPLTYAIWYLIGIASLSDGVMNVIGFKLASWLAHGLSAVGAWWVIGLVLRHRVAAIIGGLIFALHPIQVESAAWTTGLKDLLCGLFSFVTIGFYLRYVEHKKRRDWRLAVLGAVLAVASKPTAVVLPAMLLVVDLLYRSTTWKKRLASLWPMILVAGISAVVIWNVQHAANLETQPLELRPLIAADSLAFYLKQIAWPVNFSVDYAHSPAAARHSGQLLWTWVIPVLFVTAILAVRDHKARLVLALFILPILPVSGLVMFDMQQYSTVADHYAYQSMLGIGLLTGMAIVRWPKLRWVSLVVLLAWSGLTIQRLITWQHLDRLYSENIRLHSSTLMARGGLIALAFDRKDVFEVERLAREVIALSPNEVAYDNLSQALVHQHRLPEAATAARKALGFHSSHITVDRARLMLKLAAMLEDEQLARLAAEHWIGLEPANPTPRAILEQIKSQNPSSGQ